MRALSRWIWSRRSGRRALVLLLLAFTLPMSFMPLMDRFTALTGGMMPLDNQLTLTPAQMHEQLGRWPAEAISVYHWFAALDFVFPPVFGLAMAFAWAYLAAKLPGDRGERLAERGLLALPLLSPLCDWIENIGNLLAIASLPEFDERAAYLAIAGKYGKYLGLGLTTLGTLALLGLLLRAWARRSTTD